MMNNSVPGNIINNNIINDDDDDDHDVADDHHHLKRERELAKIRNSSHPKTPSLTSIHHNVVNDERERKKAKISKADLDGARNKIQNILQTLS